VGAIHIKQGRKKEIPESLKRRHIHKWEGSVTKDIKEKCDKQLVRSRKL
jgi:hypothetical protein